MIVWNLFFLCVGWVVLRRKEMIKILILLYFLIRCEKIFFSYKITKCNHLCQGVKEIILTSKTEILHSLSL